MSVTQSYKTITISPETTGVIIGAIANRIGTIKDMLLQIGTSPKFDREDEALRAHWADELDRAELAMAEFRAQLELAAAK